MSFRQLGSQRIEVAAVERQGALVAEGLRREGQLLDPRAEVVHHAVALQEPE
jgi:hypothetical protein